MILGLGVTLGGCLFQNSPTLDLTSPPATEDNTIVSVDPTLVSTALLDEFNQVRTLAQTWRSDAQFYALTVSWPSNLARGRARRVYVFASPIDPNNWWTVAVNEQTEERMRSLIPREDYLEPMLEPIPMDFWKLNEIQAIQAAEANGGKAFREANPGAEVSATLARRGPNNWLWWVVRYRGLDDKDLIVRIHPGSGEIYNEQGEPVNSTPTVTETSSAT